MTVLSSVLFKDSRSLTKVTVKDSSFIVGRSRRLANERRKSCILEAMSSMLPLLLLVEGAGDDDDTSFPNRLSAHQGAGQRVRSFDPKFCWLPCTVLDNPERENPPTCSKWRISSHMTFATSVSDKKSKCWYALPAFMACCNWGPFRISLFWQDIMECLSLLLLEVVVDDGCEACANARTWRARTVTAHVNLWHQLRSVTTRFGRIIPVGLDFDVSSGINEIICDAAHSSQLTYSNNGNNKPETHRATEIVDCCVWWWCCYDIQYKPRTTYGRNYWRYHSSKVNNGGP